MELTVKQPALLKEMEILQGVVERKNTVPMLANVLLSANGEGLETMATDLEVSVRARMTAAVKKEGGVCVSAKKLYEIVRLLPDKDITLKEDAEHHVTLTCDRSRFRIMGLSTEEYPQIPSAGKSVKVKIKGSVLKALAEKVIFAVTSDDARFALNGALMIIDGKTISLVASDGHRLAHATDDLDGKAAEERILVPRKALAELTRMTGPEDEILYCRKENHLFFEVGGRLMSSRVLEGTFPNFEKVIPVGNDKIIEFNRAEVTAALNRVSVLANERSRAVKLSVKDGTAEFSTKNPESGDASESMAVEYRGDDVEVGFNGKYILDFLGAISTDTVRFELKDELTQGILRPGGENSARYTYVVMPMRL